MIRRAAFATALGMLLSTASVSAGGVQYQIQMFDLGYNPKTQAIQLDQAVSWNNPAGNADHTSTADRFQRWNLNVPDGATSVGVAFKEAGTFAYHCTIHPQMQGSIRVRMDANPTTGTPSTLFVIRVATVNAASGFRHDIQKRRAGGTFSAWKSITGQTTTFDPTRKGTYEFRGRLRKLSNGKATGWSPILSVAVN